MSELESYLASLPSLLAGTKARTPLEALSALWLAEATRVKYVYQLSWLGRPIIQLPQDIVALEEIVWRQRPDLVVETGIAHGGSLVFYASLLELIGGAGRVVGVDIDIRAPNRAAIEAHPFAGRIELIEGSSIGPEVIARVHDLARGKERVLVVLDSMHTHAHVLAELEAYSPLVKKDGYLVVLDTAIEDVPDDCWTDRPWGVGNSPKTAVHAFLANNDRFEIDVSIQQKMLLTAAPDGYLRAVR